MALNYDVVRDRRVLRAFSARHGMEFDKVWKYCVNATSCPTFVEYKGEKYRLMYFDGCFCPFLVKLR